jgi:hypothetical protein
MNNWKRKEKESIKKKWIKIDTERMLKIICLV